MEEESQKTAKIRLITATLTHWEQLGGSGISARKLSDSADLAVSSIYHHFGSLEQLLVMAQDSARQETEAWLWRCLEQLAPTPRSPAQFAGFFAGLIDEWSETQRLLAFAWREGQLIGTRDARFSDSASQWNLLWTRFWNEAAGMFGLGEFAPLILRIFDNESLLHLFRWRRLVDRAALEEMAAGLSAWMGMAPTPAAPWRDFARAEALRERPDQRIRDETTRQILDAVAELIGEVGAANVTHRGVADRTGLTLGVVSHKFRTKSDLLHGAYEAIYARGVAPLHSGEVRVPKGDPDAAIEGLITIVRNSRAARTNDELNIAVARDPALRPFGVKLRYLRGQTSTGLLDALLGGEIAVSPLDGAIFSAFLSSQIRQPPKGHHADDPKAVRAELEQVIAILRRRSHVHPAVTGAV